MKVLPDLAVPAPDGTDLVGDLFLPASTPAPCVVVRTPYGAPAVWPEAAALAGAGIAVLVQDVRGRHRSGGAFRLGADEGPDGTATLDWVAAQAWSDGSVLLSGLGYEAFAAWCAAGHPAVRAVASRQPWPAEGLPALDDDLWWRTEIGTGRALRPGLVDLITAGAPGLDPAAPGIEAAWPVPLDPWPPTPGTWAAQAGAVARAVGAVRVPSLHVGSWYCASAATTLRHVRLASDATAVMGGWASPLTHRLRPECALDVPEGPDPADLTLTWLAAVAHGAAWEPEERLLVLGRGWTDGDPVPPAAPRHRRPPLPGGAVLRHDPADPVPSLPHSADLGPPRERPDVLALSVPGPLAWHGSARLTADVRSPAEAELVATFTHLRPDGVRTRVADASAPIARGAGRAELTSTPTALALPAGHTLHVEITLGRPPRRPAPAAAIDVEIAPLALLIPEPEART